MGQVICVRTAFVRLEIVGQSLPESNVAMRKTLNQSHPIVVRLGRFVESFISVRQTQKVLLVLNVKQMMSVPTLVNFVLLVVATPLLEERLVRRLLNVVLMNVVI